MKIIIHKLYIIILLFNDTIINFVKSASNFRNCEDQLIRITLVNLKVIIYLFIIISISRKKFFSLKHSALKISISIVCAFVHMFELYTFFPSI